MKFTMYVLNKQNCRMERITEEEIEKQRGKNIMGMNTFEVRKMFLDNACGIENKDSRLLYSKEKSYNAICKKKKENMNKLIKIMGNDIPKDTKVMAEKEGNDFMVYGYDVNVEIAQKIWDKVVGRKIAKYEMAIDIPKDINKKIGVLNLRSLYKDGHGGNWSEGAFGNMLISLFNTDNLICVCVGNKEDFNKAMKIKDEEGFRKKIVEIAKEKGKVYTRKDKDKVKRIYHDIFGKI